MTITKSIGKNTLGGGKKMTTELKNYSRSTHDLSYAWRNTQAPGTGVPFMNELVLPGDTFDIELRSHILTHPTIGPMFGSMKFQADLFFCPMRLYCAPLHNNSLNVGMDMKKVKLPQIKLNLIWNKNNPDINKIHPSCVMAYLGQRSWGTSFTGADGITPAQQLAVPLIAYYDIFKNYYANKQEEKFPIITGNAGYSIDDHYTNKEPYWKVIQITGTGVNSDYANWIESPKSTYGGIPLGAINSTTRRLLINTSWLKENNIDANKIIVQWGDGSYKAVKKTALLNSFMESNNTITNLPDEWTAYVQKTPVDQKLYIYGIAYESLIDIDTFNLEDIDETREELLAGRWEQQIIGEGKYPQYLEMFTQRGAVTDSKIKTRSTPPENSPIALNTSLNQFGLWLKTYQSDQFNNWINTEWIDGTNGVNAVTAIDTSGGSFTLDTLNLSKKVYDMLNRIAISGGTYNDWIETVYTTNYFEKTETPIYLGGYSSEIEFQEVISNSATADEPLGTLAGRGVQTQGKGGRVKFKVDEPGFIIGICSITPRVDYCQGNRFYTMLQTMNDIHKPPLDGIGFQDLTCEKLDGDMLKWKENGTYYLKSIGKQPAWLDYMTNHNRTYGNFAIKDNEAFMCLNRWYDKVIDNQGYETRDWSTYIDPRKYNYIFADTDLSAQNFWIQIGVGIKARRVMSAKIIPNL
jgi:hypothetical protein